VYPNAGPRTGGRLASRHVGANLFGIDVSGLDVPRFLVGARTLFPLLALAWLFALSRVRRSWWLFLGVLLANAYVWGETTYPLQRLYALGSSHDRVGNVALCQVVAASGQPLHTAQVGQLHFEPFWAGLVAVLAGGDPDRLLRLYAVLPLAMACGFAVSLYVALRPGVGPGWSGWERALVAAGATLLSSSALDFTGVYRAPWALTFLLKPNHALGLVLLPWVLRAFAGIRTWRGRVGVGVLLHLLGWVFVVHMVYVSFGFVLFALVTAWRDPAEAGQAWRDVGVVLGVNVLVVSPYLAMLLVGYPIFQPGPRMQIPPGSAHLLEVTTGAGVLFLFALWGARTLWHRRDVLARLWLAQAMGALALWLAYYVLSPLQLAKERDELFYWTRFLAGILAGLGAWDAASRAAALWRPGLAAWARAALVCGLALPLSLPYWWDPLRMDAYFAGSVSPLPEIHTGPARAVRAASEPHDVVAGDAEAARWVAALTGRRGLLVAHLHMPRDYGARLRFTESLVRGGAPGPPAYRVRHLLVTPALLAQYPPVTLEDLDRRPDLRRIHLSGGAAGEWVAVYEVLGAP
jgi:hypothetical protein